MRRGERRLGEDESGHVRKRSRGDDYDARLMTRDDEPAASFSGRVGRDRGGSGAAIGLITVLVIGIATAIASGRPDGPADGSVGPSAPPTAAGPTPRVAATSTPECDPIDPAGPLPWLRLGSQRDTTGIRGRPGAHHEGGATEPGPDVQVPGIELALEVGVGEPLHLVLGTADCLVAATVDGAPTGLVGTSRLVFLDATFEAPEARVIVPPLPDGRSRDWVVRIVATYWTGVPGPAGVAWTEQFFRVRISPEPHITPPPRPMVTPAVPCMFFVAEGGVGARLYIPGSQPVFGPPDPEDAPLVVAQDRLPLEIHLDGDGCAIEWVVEYRSPDGSDLFVVESVGNRTADPTFISQNRWVVDAPPLNESLLHIRYRSSASGDWLEAWWRVLGPPGE